MTKHSTSETQDITFGPTLAIKGRNGPSLTINPGGIEKRGEKEKHSQN
jgi:hypothetical protein